MNAILHNHSFQFRSTFQVADMEVIRFIPQSLRFIGGYSNLVLRTIMKIPVEVIKNFSEDSVINIISGTWQDSSSSVMYNQTFNPIDKIIELYEKRLQDKDSVIALLKSLLEKK